MLTKVEIFSPRITLPLIPSVGGAPVSDAIQIRGIEGLGPVRANVNTTPFGSVDGEAYTGSVVGKRNIVLTLGLNPNWLYQTMTSLRQQLYAYLMPKSLVKLRFSTDEMAPVEISGYVESFEPNIFSKDPEVQVSVICPLPDLIAVTATVLTDVVSDPTLETAIEYIGTVPTGILVKIATSASQPSESGVKTITVKTPVIPQVFTAQSVVDSTQFFEMSSAKGAKYVRSVLVSNGAITSLLRTMGALSVWPRLEPGSNRFSVSAVNTGQAWTLTYFNRFGGL